MSAQIHLSFAALYSHVYQHHRGVCSKRHTSNSVAVQQIEEQPSQLNMDIDENEVRCVIEANIGHH